MKIRKMKDSGLVWVGEVPAHWQVLPNKYVLRKTKRICEKWSGQPVLSLSMKGVFARDLLNPTGKMPTTFDGYQYVEAGNALMCLFDYDVTPRCVGRALISGVTSPAYSCFEVLKNATLDWVYYYYLMVDNGKEILHLARNLRHAFNESDFGEIKMPLPPLEEQQRLTDCLDRACAKIDEIVAGTKQTIEEHKAWKASLIFETVTGKVETGFTGLTGLSGGTNPVNPVNPVKKRKRPMRDSGVAWLGEVPEGWGVKRLKHVVEIRSDSGEYSPEIGHYIGLENIVSSGGYVETDTKYEQAIYARCRKGDLLYSKLRPYLAKCILSPLDAFCTGEFLVVSRYDGPMEFLRYWFLSANVTEAINASTYGSKMPRANEGFILNLPYLCPPVSVQQEIVSFLDKKCAAIDRVIAEKEALIADLEAYRKSLIFEVVTGKRSVGENGLVA